MSIAFELYCNAKKFHSYNPICFITFLYFKCKHLLCIFQTPALKALYKTKKKIQHQRCELHADIFSSLQSSLTLV